MPGSQVQSACSRHGRVPGSPIPALARIPRSTTASRTNDCGIPRRQKSPRAQKKSPEPVVPGIFLGWQMRDSNPRRRCQLIYSQPPLAARVICRTSKEDHFRRPFLLDPVTEGRDNLTEVFAKNLIGSRRPGIRRISGFSEDPTSQFGFELLGLLSGDLVELHGAKQVSVHSVHPGSGVRNRA
jgi:hypothetical protein